LQQHLREENLPVDNNNIIEVKNLTKTFGKFTALDEISFKVKKGEIFGLLGPNGAGKSTTLRILSTLAKPTSGKATIGGHDIEKEANKVREMLEIVSEKMIIYDKFTPEPSVDVRFRCNAKSNGAMCRCRADIY
jgi:ABC-2 type transport system ATP-binding protein